MGFSWHFIQFSVTVMKQTSESSWLKQKLKKYFSQLAFISNVMRRRRIQEEKTKHLAEQNMLTIAIATKQIGRAHV